MPLQTEALAVINELPKGDPVQREAQVRIYAHQLADASLRDYPSDDETVTTIAWIVSIGGTFDDPEASFTFGEADALTLQFVTDTGVTTASVLATDPAATELGEYSTRGSVRRLLDALGVSHT